MTGHALGSRWGAGRTLTRSLLAAPLAVLLSLSGCLSVVFAPPTSTYVDEDGETVRLNWREFPGWGGSDPQDALDGPTVETGVARANEMLAAAEAALSERFEGGSWELRDNGIPADGLWTATSNGYGGASLLYVYNSPRHELELRIPQAKWIEVIETVAEVAAKHGLTERLEAEPESALDTARQSKTFEAGGETLAVTVGDASLDKAALAEAEQYGWLVSGITLSYGVDTLHEADRAELERRVQPFLGQPHPDITD